MPTYLFTNALPEPHHDNSCRKQAAIVPKPPTAAQAAICSAEVTRETNVPSMEAWPIPARRS
jgi:hypothetical protein